LYSHWSMTEIKLFDQNINYQIVKYSVVPKNVVKLCCFRYSSSTSRDVIIHVLFLVPLYFVVQQHQSSAHEQLTTRKEICSNMKWIIVNVGYTQWEGDYVTGNTIPSLLPWIEYFLVIYIYTRRIIYEKMVSIPLDVLVSLSV
jgi:hypothetical protein